MSPLDPPVPAFVVRDATDADAAACARIYAPFVLETAISFELVPPTAAEMAVRIAEAQSSYAWLVLEQDGEVVGYAYAGPHSKRAAYRWAAEVSVYLDRERHGRGGGRALYEALLPRLASRGVQVATACMTVPNPASRGLHLALGFEPTGAFADIGWKLGEWRSIEWFQLRLRPTDAATVPVEPA